MNFMSSMNEIRSKFFEYFETNGHEIVSSGPLVPRNDPTLMFTNAGMVQFKNVFTGLEKRPYSQAVTAQKCVRAGGKHNDLDNVGYTARHHTFFEMLGNFSFGDYFKDRAIELAWNLITKEFSLPKDRLLVTVYSEDDVAFDLWKKIAGLSENKIIRIPTSDNFWSMGATGPCGPCSEIFYDHGEGIPGGPPGSADEDGDRFIEIWNLVFMQFEQVSENERIDLPKPSIDTGMGLERITAVLQGQQDNYDTDLFKAIIDEISSLSGVEPSASHKVIADHLRASGFLIAEGVLPSNEGRGYVLRRIMRRALRHVQLLGVEEPMMFKLVPSLVREMGQAYPELVRANSTIEETLKLEETKFRKTLTRGLSILEDETNSLKKGDTLTGDIAFKLYDTYGFPLDLTQEALRSRSITVDVEGFETAMEQQKKEARKAWAGSGETETDKIWFEISEKHNPTEFLGYESESVEGEVLAVVSNGKEVKKLNKGDQGFVIVNQTSFYAESGGQVGDNGIIEGADFQGRISDTQKKPGGLFTHQVELTKGELTVGLPVSLIVDHGQRVLTRANHSATHLLHEALRIVLGQHVEQKGSLVSSERLRFDFSHQKPVSELEIQKIEDIANEIVLQNSEVQTRLMSVDDAIESGARALFGEKYGEEVRVVTMGRPLNGKKQEFYSMELCGGTHVEQTGEIGLIHLINESAVASGVRRIEALTGKSARKYLENQSVKLREVAGILKVGQNDVSNRVLALVDERKKIERELGEANKKLAMGGGDSGSSDENIVKQIAEFKVMSKILSGIKSKDLKNLVDEGKKSIETGIVVFATEDEGKAGIVVGVTADLTKKVSAIDLVQIGSQAVDGKGGGGRPDMAQAGGPSGNKLNVAISAIEEHIAQI